MILAYDPLGRTAVSSACRPTTRSVLRAGSLFVNQVLSFFAAHLDEPRQSDLVVVGDTGSELPTVLENCSTRRGAGASASIEQAAMMGILFAQWDESESSDDELDLMEVSCPTDADFLVDWLALLEPDVAPADTWTPAVEGELDALTDWVMRDLVVSDDTCERSALAMALESTLSRCITRSNALRRTYTNVAKAVAELPELSLAYPHTSIVFCDTTPELAWCAANVACECCCECDKPQPDAVRMNQLRLPF